MSCLPTPRRIAIMVSNVHSLIMLKSKAIWSSSLQLLSSYSSYSLECISTSNIVLSIMSSSQSIVVGLLLLPLRMLKSSMSSPLLHFLYLFIKLSLQRTTTQMNVIFAWVWRRKESWRGCCLNANTCFTLILLICGLILIQCVLFVRRVLRKWQSFRQGVIGDVAIVREIWS